MSNNNELQSSSLPTIKATKLCLCNKCGKEVLPGCDGLGTVHVGPCAFTGCDNLKAHQRELWEMKRSKNANPTHWEDVEGTGLLKTTAYRVFSVGKTWVIARDQTGRLRAIPKKGLSLNVRPI